MHNVSGLTTAMYPTGVIMGNYRMARKKRKAGDRMVLQRIAYYESSLAQLGTGSLFDLVSSSFQAQMANSIKCEKMVCTIYQRLMKRETMKGYRGRGVKLYRRYVIRWVVCPIIQLLDDIQISG